LTKGLEKIEKLIGWYGSNGFAVGSSLTWADIFLYDISTGFASKVQDASTKYPLYYAVIQNVSNNEKIKSYVAKRPETPV
jgi:hypothetical protein